MQGKRQTLSEAAEVTDPRVEVRRRNQRTVMSAMLVLLTIVTASTWLGCNGGESHTREYWGTPRPPPTPPPADPSQCSNGTAVPDPLENPGLVEDCETLLMVRDRLAGDGWLYWGGETSILRWEGVYVEAKEGPLRVDGGCNFSRED